jgi:hypothetical protein
MRSENAKNKIAARERCYKLINWMVQVKLIEDYFRSVAEESKAQRHIETLCVSRNDSERQIQLFAGSHAIGSVEVKRDPMGREIGRRHHAEHGAALVISQSALGDGAVLFYPYSSEKLQAAEEYIVWRVFNNPAQITRSVLQSAVRDFFAYCRTTSALCSESAADRYRVRYLSFRGRKYIGGGGLANFLFSRWFLPMLGAIGSVASIYSLCK